MVYHHLTELRNREVKPKILTYETFVFRDPNYALSQSSSDNPISPDTFASQQTNHLMIKDFSYTPGICCPSATALGQYCIQPSVLFTVDID